MFLATSPRGKFLLPTALGNARDFAIQSQFAKLHAADAKAADVSARAAGELATVVEAYGRSIARQLIEGIVVAFFFEFFAQFSVLCHHALALSFSGYD